MKAYHRKEEFLKRRRFEIDNAQKQYGHLPGFYVVDPGNEIICDACNADAGTGEYVVEDVESGYVLCPDCVERWSKDEANEH